MDSDKIGESNRISPTENIYKPQPRRPDATVDKESLIFRLPDSVSLKSGDFFTQFQVFMDTPTPSLSNPEQSYTLKEVF
ncbi:hypothetical protein COB72_05570 [bacterium]|nr:MAG: hypothetical protein COB72_05570 [bacterium]